MMIDIAVRLLYNYCCINCGNIVSHRDLVDGGKFFDCPFCKTQTLHVLMFPPGRLYNIPRSDIW